jgi:hypothetical protein
MRITADELLPYGCDGQGVPIDVTGLSSSDRLL